MAEILIKGMEMPKTCRRCMEMEIPVRCRVMEQEAVTAVMSGYDRPSDCPLIELPPHGRLVDADKLKLKKKHSSKEFFENVVSVFDIDNAQTVLEATE